MKMNKFGILIFANITNYVLVLLSALLFSIGYRLFPILIVAQLIWTVLNYFVSENIKQQLILSINLLISTILANCLSVFLYMRNISADSGTLYVGKIALLIGIIYVFIISAIAILVKYNRTKSNQKQP